MRRLLLVLALFSVAASPIPAERAVNAIIGEAEDQGFMGMLYIGCAVRNRGTLDGVFGENAPRVVGLLYDSDVYMMATTAWRVSEFSAECKDLKGATHWDNIKAFGLPWWAPGMIETYRYKDHVFYKQKPKQQRRKRR